MTPALRALLCGLWLGLATPALAQTPPPTEQAECNPDCPEGQECVEGYCIAVEVEPDPNVCDPECAENEECIENACVPKPPTEPEVIPCDPECRRGEECIDGQCHYLDDRLADLKEKVCFYRVGGWFVGKTPILIDEGEELLARIHKGRYFCVRTEAGGHRYRAQQGEQDILYERMRVYVEPGRTMYVQVLEGPRMVRGSEEHFRKTKKRKRKLQKRDGRDIMSRRVT